jgi:hypothetical protein
MTDMVSPLPWRVNTGEEVIDADGRLVSIDGRQQLYNPHFVVAAVNAAKDLAALLNLVSRQQEALRGCEWCFGELNDQCPWCQSLASEGHDETCFLGSLLPREPK